MRIVSPEDDPGKRPRIDQHPAAGRVIDLVLPFALFKERFCMRFQVENESEADSIPTSIRGINRMIIVAGLVLLLVSCVAGMIFLIYLAKSLSGIDVFPNEHLLK